MKKTRNYLKRDFKKERTADKLSVNERSLLMSKICSKNTKFEQFFISFLRKKTSLNFKTNVVKIKGKPDIVFTRIKIAIFLDSDFWHGWQFPRWKHSLKNDFWREKIKKNRERDRKTTIYLKKNGWKVIRLWEHEIETDINKAIKKIVDLLQKQTQNKQNIMNRTASQKCAKRHVVAIIEKDGKFYVGSDWCRNPQKKCPRLPGEDYTKCKTICDQDGHAELDAIKNAKGDTKGGIMYLIGHDHCCDPCLAAMKKAGIETIIFNKYPKEFNK